jgi:hypothetical protein
MRRRALRVITCAIFMLSFGCDDGGGDDEPGAEAGTGDDGGGDSTDAGDAGDLPPDMAPAPPCFEDSACPDDRYCNIPEGAFEGVCTVGCRIDVDNPQSTCAERQICGPDNQCVKDPSCELDEHCNPNEYCDENNVCVPGCRVFEDPVNDLCPASDDDFLQLCNPEDHRCALAIACCDAQDCGLFLADDPACGLALHDRHSCFNPNPCRDRCANGDGDCEDNEYCNEDSQCEVGCRPDGRSPCPGQVCDPESRECVPLE